MVDIILRAIGGDSWALGVLFVIFMPIFLVVSLVVAGVKKLTGKD